YSVDIPRTVLRNALIMGFPSCYAELRPLPWAGQVRPLPMLMADEAGRITLRGEVWRDASLFACGFDRNFQRITAAQDLGDNEARFSSTLTATAQMTFAHRSLVTFKSQKTDILGFTTPLTLEPVPQL